MAGMHTLSGNLHKQLQEALLSAFPSYSALEQMVRFQLDENLEKLVGRGSLDSVVFHLINWAEANGRIDDLIRGARIVNSGSPKLKEFCDALYEKPKDPITNSALDKDRKLRVFLCHASQDKAFVSNLYQKLCSEDWIDPWLDQEKILPGQDWDREIEIALEDSEAVIVFISAKSVSKEGYVQREVKKALDLAQEKLEGSIFVIPLRLDDTPLPRSLKRWQYIDLFPVSSAPAGYNRLLQSLKLRYART